MTEKELREKIGLKENELLNTSIGHIDIFGVKDNIVSYGSLAGGNVMSETVEEFLSHFPHLEN
jgi:hypothetical protein